MPALREAWSYSKATLERLRAVRNPSVPLLRSIRQETVLLLQIDMQLSRAEARQKPMVDQPQPSKWAGVLS